MSKTPWKPSPEVEELCELSRLTTGMTVKIAEAAVEFYHQNVHHEDEEEMENFHGTFVPLLVAATGQAVGAATALAMQDRSKADRLKNGKDFLAESMKIFVGIAEDALKQTIEDDE
ncbi:MAG: hypothetical protein GY952_13965 [Rhodobacteraceae bacterium]|nr:hypothetical protein [Paracoccaceae bacterium]